VFDAIEHGVLFLGNFTNRVIIFKLDNEDSIHFSFTLDDKYCNVSAVHNYTNIIFIGTQDSYLLAYRINSFYDLVQLTNENL